eukprot:1195358-Prorocentrum_minimum.AAC.8
MLRFLVWRKPNRWLRAITVFNPKYLACGQSRWAADLGSFCTVRSPLDSGNLKILACIRFFHARKRGCFDTKQLDGLGIGLSRYRYRCACSETYQYFDLPFCPPIGGVEHKSEDLGEVRVRPT